MRFLKVELGITPKVFVGLTHCELCDYSKERLINKIKNRYSSIRTIAEIDARQSSNVLAFLDELHPETGDGERKTKGGLQNYSPLHSR